MKKKFINEIVKQINAKCNVDNRTDFKLLWGFETLTVNGVTEEYAGFTLYSEKSGNKAIGTRGKDGTCYIGKCCTLNLSHKVMDSMFEHHSGNMINFIWDMVEDWNMQHVEGHFDEIDPIRLGDILFISYNATFEDDYFRLRHDC